MLVRLPRFVVQIFRKAEKQNIAQEIEDGFFQGRVPPLCGRDRALDNVAIFVADRLSRRHISPVNGETGDGFPDRARECVQREIAKPTILFREPVQHITENVHVIRERQARDQPLLRIHEMAERHRVPDETLERFRDCLFRGSVDKNVRDELRKFVAGRPVHRPIRTQIFVTGQDFFDDDINRAAVFRKRNPERGRGAPLQLLEIFLRQIKAVRMIDADAGDRAVPDQFEEQLVGRVEDFRQLHSDRGQIVHVEEAPVINFFRRDAPEGEPIRLIVQERIERIKTARVAGGAIDLRDRLHDRGLDLRRFLAAALEPSLDDFLFSCALRYPSRIRRGSSWQIFERRNDALEFRIEILVLERRQFLERDLQNVAIRAGRDRKFVFVIAEIERARLEANL